MYAPDGGDNAVSIRGPAPHHRDTPCTQPKPKPSPAVARRHPSWATARLGARGIAIRSANSTAPKPLILTLLHRESLRATSLLVDAICKVESGERLYVTHRDLPGLVNDVGCSFGNHNWKTNLELHATDKWDTVLGKCPYAPRRARTARPAHGTTHSGRPSLSITTIIVC
jgi:hypothetical protein